MHSFNLQLDKRTAVNYFYNQILRGKKDGHKSFKIIVRDQQTYANVCAPIAGIIDYFKLQGMTFKLFFDNPHSYARSTQIDNPKIVEKEKGGTELHYPLDKVWKFSTSEGVKEIVDALILAVRQGDVVEEGVITSLEWCLNESLDNVLQHSEVGYGYVMAQHHKNQKQFSVCVFDSGIGFFNSLKDSKHHPRTRLDAITLALQEKVTRDDKIGQGNGLWGLSRIIEDGHGTLLVCSAGASYMMKKNGSINTEEEGYFQLDKKHGTALIDFQMNYDNPVNIDKALNGHHLTDLWLDNLENDDGEVYIKIAEQAGGTGTRKSAEKMRNMVLNIAKTEKKKVTLDFSGVNLISSSFADELFGKIISQYGILFFMKKFDIINLTSSNNSVINRSIMQRMAQTYYDETLGSLFTEIFDEELNKEDKN